MILVFLKNKEEYEDTSILVDFNLIDSSDKDQLEFQNMIISALKSPDKEEDVDNFRFSLNNVLSSEMINGYIKNVYISDSVIIWY